MTEHDGLPVFQYDQWPEGMFTARQLREKGLAPGPVAGLIPYSKSKDGDGYLRVYKLDEAQPKPPLDAAAQAAVERMQAGKLAKRTCQRCGRAFENALYEGICHQCGAVTWAQAIVAQPFVVLDTETTGIEGGEIIAVSVIDPAGAVLLDTYVQPLRPIVEVEFEDYDEDNWKHRRYGPGLTAFGVNGISNAMVAGAPTWPEVAALLRPILVDKVVVCYNEDFDHQRMLDPNCELHGLPPLEAAGWECLMLAFAAWYGEWNDRYHDWKFQSLGTAAVALGVLDRGEAHVAVGDCYTTLGVLKALAAGAAAAG